MDGEQRQSIQSQELSEKPLGPEDDHDVRAMRTFGRNTIEFIKVFVIAAAIILPIRLFLVQPFYVKGPSMEPNFHDNEYLIIDKLTPHFRPIQRGEVVVLRYSDPEARFLIKRVIGLPGERISIQDRVIRIYSDEHPDGFVLHEDAYTPRQTRDIDISKKLKDNEYYVLGDNRPNSKDSEVFGPITRSQIVGRVVLRGLPIDKFTLYHPPEYR